ncbi:class I SAM-dependent methyltransferase [Candidatus Acetothermia bacterium]|nr:class I SAM-dependent methyltransferase [Candidatus Acetothermia bacterium]MBI3642736.1 class I SAM-dependent methyltransferase [Candidatus Acetothermia bacterium]
MSYQKSAKIYDAVYAAIGKDYLKESQRVRELIEQYKRSSGNSLLDVACGTGKHLTHLKEWYKAEGLDLEENMIAIAKERLPGIPFHHGDMIEFDLGKQFDAIVFLFSSIGYAKTPRKLNKAISNMAKHLHFGGVSIIEPWFKPEDWKPGSVHAIFVNEPELKVARMNVSGREGILAIMDMHYEVGSPEGVEHFREMHKMGLFTHDEYLNAFRKASLEVSYDAEGLMNRGLYIGVKP